MTPFLKYLSKFFIMDAVSVQYIISLKKAMGSIILIKGALMDPKLVKQFIIFMVLLFGWTIVILLAGAK